MTIEKETPVVARLSWTDRIGIGAFGFGLLAIFIIGVVYAVSRADDNSEKYNALYKSTLELRYAVIELGREVDPKFKIKSDVSSAD